MKQIAIFISFVFCFNSTLFGQKNLTKEEIYHYWTAGERPDKQDSLIVWFDRETNYTAHRLIDSLHNFKIDSIIVYSVAYPGYIGKSTCIDKFYPIYTYVIWKTNGRTIIKKIEGSCVFNQEEINSTVLFDFYDEHQQQINSEFIMPAIYSAEMDTNGKFSYIENIVDHEPKYFLYFNFGKNYRVIQFSEHDLQDNKSLFYSDNLNSKMYQWWTVIKSQATE